jgi:hypothetical protein
VDIELNQAQSYHMWQGKKLSSLLSKIEAKIADFVKQTAEYTE